MNEEVLKILLSLLAGVLIGLEREYKSKAAGLRTITLITVGSTLFTIMSRHFGLSSPDRVASNIVTGIGFLGAGVIFKGDQGVSGLTTAATIWTAAAIGMCIGGGDYLLAGCTLAVTLFVLLVLRSLQRLLNNRHQIRTYKLVFHLDKMSNDDLEEVFRKFRLSFIRLKEYRNIVQATSVYEISGQVTRLDEMNEYLMSSQLLDSFDY